MAQLERKAGVFLSTRSADRFPRPIGPPNGGCLKVREMGPLMMIWPGLVGFF